MKYSRALLQLGLLLCVAACSESGPGETQQQAATPQGAIPPEAAACELVMGWDPWEPYQYEIAGGHVFGLDVDLLTAVVRNSGCEIKFAKGTWRDLLAQLKAGEIDLLGGATPTADREAFAYFTDPYRDEQFTLYIASNRLADLGNKQFDQLMDEGMRFGVIEDYLYGDPITAFQDDPQYQDRFDYASMAETNIAQLLDGKVDGIIEDKYVGASIIRHKNLGEAISAHPLSFNSSPVSIMVSRVSVDDELFEKLNRSVQELQANGAFDMVLAQYVNP